MNASNFVSILIDKKDFNNILSMTQSDTKWIKALAIYTRTNFLVNGYMALRVFYFGKQNIYVKN